MWPSNTARQQPVSAAAPVPEIAWFCLRSQPKHEHIAARHLQQMEGVEVCNPRLRFPRPTRHGPVWVTEALFPSYLFARFNWTHSLARVHYAPGVSGVVHFGERWPTVPDDVIEELRATLGEDEVHVIPSLLQPGDPVEITVGSFHGLEAVITQLLPGRQRVMVLMDFLGRQTTVEVGIASITRRGFKR
jgi:transcriptional antiterminator RfaH